MCHLSLDYDELRKHAGHKVEIRTYGRNPDEPDRVGLECIRCGTMIAEIENPHQQKNPAAKRQERHVELSQHAEVTKFAAPNGEQGYVSSNGDVFMHHENGEWSRFAPDTGSWQPITAEFIEYKKKTGGDGVIRWQPRETAAPEQAATGVC